MSEEVRNLERRKSKENETAREIVVLL